MVWAVRQDSHTCKAGPHIQARQGYVPLLSYTSSPINRSLPLGQYCTLMAVTLPGFSKLGSAESSGCSLLFWGHIWQSSGFTSGRVWGTI